MANVDAFNEGFDAGMGKKAKKKAPKPVKQITTDDNQTLYPSAPLRGYKKGGKVRRTGPIYAHKGEHVLTVAQTKAYAGKKGKKKAARKRVAGKR